MMVLPWFIMTSCWFFKPLYKAHSIFWKVRPICGGLDLRKGLCDPVNYVFIDTTIHI